MSWVRFGIRSHLSCTPSEAWAHATSVAGIRAELAPWLSMTFPASIAELDEDTIPLGQRLCRSWILLGGVLPVEYDDLTIVELEPGRRFLERSQLLSARSWEHERSIDPEHDGCTLTDRLGLLPRRGVPGGVARRVVRALFRHRHHQLRRILGGARFEEL